MPTWFPIGKDALDGWRLDVIALLAVTGESFMAEHAQAITSCVLCRLPRIMPAPHALLRPRRPAGLPSYPAVVTGVRSGVALEAVGFFANILHPLDQMPALGFQVLEIRHSEAALAEVFGRPKHRSLFGNRRGGADPESVELADGGTDGTREGGGDDPENYRDPASLPPLRRGTALKEKTPIVPVEEQRRNAVMVPFLSPLHILTVLSCFISIGLIATGIAWNDGTAVLAVSLISLSSSVTGFAAAWTPDRIKAVSDTDNGRTPDGDVIIRTREGALCLVKCTEAVARELYSGVEECSYRVTGASHQLLMTAAAIIIMPSVILLGNCTFNMQALIGAAYISLNAAYWSLGLLPLRFSWDMSRYTVSDITPADAKHAHRSHSLDHFRRPDHPNLDPNIRNARRSFTRTLWYAIRETKDTGWVERGRSIPRMEAWRQWLREAGTEARTGNRSWDAVGRKDEIISIRGHG